VRDENEKRGRDGALSGWLRKRLAAVNLLGDVGSDNQGLWLLMVLGKLHVVAALWEFASSLAALGPDLIKEITAAQAKEHEFGLL